MILVLTGTHEAQEVIGVLNEHQYPVLGIVQSEYGKSLAMAAGLTQVLELTEGLKLNQEMLLKHQVSAVIDATQPYPYPFTTQLRKVCKGLEIPYIRLTRQETKLADNPLIIPVFDWDEAVQIAATKGPTIFLTTGSHNLERFIKHNPHKNRIVVRVLPDHKVIKKCQDLGLSPKDIAAMQGPFSREFNRSMFKAFRASCVVTRDGGKKGGTDTKISAALSLGIPVILIKRPRIEDKYLVNSSKEAIKLLTKLDIGP